MARSLRPLLTFAAGLASATLTSRDNTTTNGTTGSRSILVGASGQITGFDFSSGMFTKRGIAQVVEAGRTPSWLIFKEPNFLYAVDENSNATRLFHYGPITAVALGGVVHLTFTKDKSILIGSSYGQGQVDVYDARQTDGNLHLIRQIPLIGRHGPDPASQTQLRAHQGVVDPTRKFLLVNDLGGDLLHIYSLIDYSHPTSIQTAPGCGPRHGAFLSMDGSVNASHYAVVCELSSMILLFSISYDDAALGLKFTALDSKFTFGPAFPPKNPTAARAGELIVAKSGAIYVSNRLSGNETDSISHFALEAKSKDDKTASLVFKGQTSSGAVAPRHMSLSKNESVIFVANMNGANELAALGIDKATGLLADKPLGMLANKDFAPGQQEGQGFGPMFVMEV